MESRDYRLVVEGELGGRAASVFEGMTVTRAGGTTTLVGPVRDQAELQGYLGRITDLGLTLISATAVNEVADR